MFITLSYIKQISKQLYLTGKIFKGFGCLENKKKTTENQIYMIHNDPEHVEKLVNPRIHRR